jgi:TolB-like protein
MTSYLFSLARTTALLCAALLLSACATNLISFPEMFSAGQDKQEATQSEPLMEQPMAAATVDSGIHYRQAPSESMTTEPAVRSLWLSPRNQYNPSYSHKSLADYAEQLTIQLMQNARQLDPSSLLGVASFVALDEKLTHSNVLGNQLAEMFIAELQQFGLAVVDFKATQYINITAKGDYVFSRDGDELAKNLALDNILSGTMITDERGVKINARIISMRSKQVMATATIFIPNFVVASLNPQYALIED